MRKILKLILSASVLMIGVLIVVPFLIPIEAYKKEATARASAMLGREVKVEGAMRLKLFPTVAVSLNDVTIGNPSGFGHAPFATIKHFDVQVPLNALLEKKIIIQSLEVDGANVALVENAAGANNWTFTLQQPQALLPDFSIIASAHAAEEKTFSLKGLALNHIAINNTNLSFISARTGAKQQLKDITLKAKAASISAPVAINGRVNWNGQDVALDATAGSIESLLSGKATALKAAIKSAAMNLTFEGKASTNAAAGALVFSTPSIPKLMAWLGSPMAWDKTALKTAIKGDASYNGTSVTLKNATLAVDDLNFQGTLGASLGGKPRIEANLTTGTLNLRPYAAAAAPSFSLIANAYAAGPWTNTPINLKGLNAVDAEVALKAEQLLYTPWDLRNLALNASLRAGALALNINQLETFGGSVRGTVTAKSTGAMGVNLKGSGLQVEPLLKQLSGNDSIRGTADVSANLTTSGATQSQLVSALSGTGNIIIRNGAIKGINLAQMSRNIRGAFTGDAGGERDTDFAELGGNFTVANGVLSNKDLAMKAPYMRLKGEGQINLPAYSINYRLTPELVDTGKGQGGADKKGLAVPVLVSGSLDNPSFAPDLAGIALDALNNPAKLKENIAAAKDIIKDNKQQINALKQQLKQPETLLQNPDLGNLLGGFGVKKKPAPAPAPQGEPQPTPAPAPQAVPPPAPAAEPTPTP